MMHSALRAIDAHSASTVMMGDRSDVDIVALLEAGMETLLVLPGISTRAGRWVLRLPPVPHRPAGDDLEVDVGAGGLG
jgi:ribonucleotide monophosphatase NagD (HAD superfamily)